MKKGTYENEKAHLGEKGPLWEVEGAFLMGALVIKGTLLRKEKGHIWK